MVKYKLLGDIPALFALATFLLMGISKGVGSRTSGARPQAEPWRGRYASRPVFPLVIKSPMKTMRFVLLELEMFKVSSQLTYTYTIIVLKQ